MICELDRVVRDKTTIYKGLQSQFILGKFMIFSVLFVCW